MKFQLILSLNIVHIGWLPSSQVLPGNDNGNPRCIYTFLSTSLLRDRLFERRILSSAIKD